MPIYITTNPEFVNSKIPKLFNYPSSNILDHSNNQIDEEIESVVMTQYTKALDLLKGAMPKLHEVAKILFEEEKISGEEFRKIMEN